MTSKELKEFLAFTIENKIPVLIKGAPGIGKSDIVTQAAKDAGAELIISHPVVSDPTDYKGLPVVIDGRADFLPFGDLRLLIEAKEKTVVFLDDLGQAPQSVQAACMQLVLARQINGKKISDEVVFVAATNRQRDMAGVSGILAPLKSRFGSIVELNVSVDEWCEWALLNNMPAELIGFIRYRPDLLNDETKTREIENLPSPRTVASVGKMLALGIPKSLEYEAVKGAVGEGFAVEFQAYLELCRELVTVEEIIDNPDEVEIPANPSVLYALTTAISANMVNGNVNPLMRFLKRLPIEMQVVAVKDAVIRHRDTFIKEAAYREWAIKNQKMVLA
ncbi:MAG: ATP-binding protein [Chitinophagaceae bacterium]|nr:ATP-binding protein [Chitinophagaceae bacterium]